ncbi:lecithin--cholesterol acyltransferase [Nostoc sp. 'Peltigera membranacea cyanobiont' 210A]|nr:lecithin--cholesterol acyltransferase [Nostoc sp. 'Peltigera membranacea cyanobiont' 210A]
MRDIVVILPGITGSVLQKDGKDIWAVSGQAAWQALRTLGDSLQWLKMAGDDPDAEYLDDGIKATRLVDDAHLVPGLVKIDGYTTTARLITDYFEVISGDIREDKPANFFKFPYDWRRDNRVNAKILKKYLDLRLKQWREYTGIKDAKVILMAHSMGGLVSRYYLEVLQGWRDCKALITFGTPFRGSLNGVNFLANGYKQQFLDLTEVMRSLPSVYQLMPIYKMLKIGNEYHRIAEAPVKLPYIIKERAENALKFHREIEDAVNSHKNDAAYHQSYKIIPIVGTKQTTFQSANFADGQLTVSLDLPTGIDSLLGDGDGTVPYLSAIPIELSSEYRETYIPGQHGSLQNNDKILGQLLERLKGMQVQGLGDIRDPFYVEVSPKAAEQPAICLTLDDLYLADEAIEVRAKILNTDRDNGQLKAKIEPVSGEGKSLNVDFEEQNGEWVLTLGDLAQGLYRLKVQTEKTGAQAPIPVSSLFEVVK